MHFTGIIFLQIAVGIMVVVVPWAAAEPPPTLRQQAELKRIELATPARVLDFSRDGSALACADDAGNIRVFGAADGKELSHLKLHPKTIRAVSFSGDGKRLAIGGELVSFPYPESPSNFSPDFAPHPPGFFTFFSEDDIRMGRLAPPEPVLTSSTPGSSSKIGFLLFVNPTDGGVVGSVKELEHPVYSVVFTGDNRALYAVDSYMNVHGFSVDGLERMYRQLNDRKIRPSRYPISLTAFSHDPLRFASVAPEVDTGRIKIKLFDILHGHFRVLNFASDPPSPWVVALSADGRRFGSSGPGPAVLVWDFDKGQPVKFLTAEGVECLNTACMALDQTGNRVVTSAVNGDLRVWDVEKRQVVFTAKVANRDVRMIRIQDDSLKVVSGGFRALNSKCDPLFIQMFTLNAKAENH